jgi:hypothetical protein
MKNPLLLAILAGSALAAPPARADDPTVPDGGFAASRYETLWTKSPFAVATSEAAPESPDYSLVGIAQFDGISYASLIEKQNQEHFLISSDKATKGLTLLSITRGHDGGDTLAVVQKDGEQITLKLEQLPAGPVTGAGALPGMPPVNSVPMPGTQTPQIPMPGAAVPSRPLVRIHRPPIHLPSPPAEQQPVPEGQPPPSPQPQPPMPTPPPTPTPGGP